MRFHIGLSLSWNTIKKWIIPICIGILVFLGYYSAHAATLTDTSSWMITRWINSSGTTLQRVDCPPYGSNVACLVTPSQIGNRISFAFRVTDQPFTFKANSTYKIKVNVINILQSEGWKPTISFERSDGVYTDSYEFSDYSMYANGDFDTWVLTFSPTSNLSIKTMTLVFTNSTSFIPDYSLGMSPNFQIIDADNTNDVIIDQNEQIIDQNKETNEKLDNLEDSITNPNIDSGTGNSFFDNFQTEDNGGISGIITAPLTLINSLLDGQGSCTDLTFPIMGKEVSLPSGCIIWDKVPNEMEILIQTLVCGTGAYFLLRQLFKDIENLKNPNNSEVSTLDL